MIRYITAVAAIVLLAVLWLAGWRFKLQTRLYWRRLRVVAAAIVVSVLVGLLPVGSISSSEVITNTDFVFLVDTTYSMNAQDGRTGKSRLADVQSDIQNIAGKLAGSRFGIITYDSSSSIYLPLTTNTADIDTSAQTLQTKSLMYSTISPNVTGAFKDTKAYLDNVAKIDATRQRVLIMMSDGELTGKTDTTASVTTAAGNLAGSVNAAVVIGYGTDSGSKLPYVENDINFKQYVETGAGYVEAPDSSGNYNPVVSKRNPQFLLSLANTLHGTYIPSTETANMVSVASNSRKAAARSKSHSPENLAIRQNILHIPLAIAILTFLFLFEVIEWPRLRALVAGKGRK